MVWALFNSLPLRSDRVAQSELPVYRHRQFMDTRIELDFNILVDRHRIPIQPETQTRCVFELKPATLLTCRERNSQLETRPRLYLG